MVCFLEGMISAVRSGKNDRTKFYADFVFMGGSAALPVAPDQVEICKKMQGQQVKISVALRPRSIAVFDRTMTVFEPVSLIKLER